MRMMSIGKVREGVCRFKYGNEWAIRLRFFKKLEEKNDLIFVSFIKLVEWIIHSIIVRTQYIYLFIKQLFIELQLIFQTQVNDEDMIMNKIDMAFSFIASVFMRQSPHKIDIKQYKPTYILKTSTKKKHREL